MPLSQLRNVDFGRTKLNATGTSGVGYQLLDSTGSVVLSRTTSGVYQVAPGIYAAPVTFPDEFHGQVLWDTGTVFPTTYYAIDQYNVEENDPRVASTYNVVLDISSSLGTLSSSVAILSSSVDVISSSAATIGNLEPKIDRLLDIQYGRWIIKSNQMVFYKEDNLTEVARFDLFDENGSPSSEAVFERVKV